MKLLTLVSAAVMLSSASVSFALEDCDAITETKDIAKRLACLQRNNTALQRQIDLELVQIGEWRCTSPGGTAGTECAEIKFEREFKKPPRVVIGFNKVAAKSSGANVLEQTVDVTNVTTTGFKPVLSTNVQLSTGGNWTALGESKDN
jgi:H-type lectin domain